MAIQFRVLAPLEVLDTPLINLRSKKFNEVILFCLDEKIRFTCDMKSHEDNTYLCRKSIYGEEIEIEIHKEHLLWVEHGKTNILPFSSIIRWVLD
ncbi:MAG: hypothetical protein IJP99_10680 [Methanobrevibacter sp.]|nr:hypothetical protein [Methanobrevibacter sp.]MBR0059783.1 hypothetical protein [Methanobrevibacter sp.]